MRFESDDENPSDGKLKEIKVGWSWTIFFFK